MRPEGLASTIPQAAARLQELGESALRLGRIGGEIRAHRPQGYPHRGSTELVNLIDGRVPRSHADVVTDVTRLLLEARRALASELDADLADRGYPDLRPADAALFLTIDRRSGSRVTDLAAGSGVTKQAMMSLVDELEDRGYVRRVPDTSDGRAKLVRLTAHGRRATTECRRAVQALEQRTRRRLGDRRYDMVREGLEEMTTAVEE